MSPTRRIAAQAFLDSLHVLTAAEEEEALARLRTDDAQKWEDVDRLQAEADMDAPMPKGVPRGRREASTPCIETGGVIRERYEVLEQLGEGGMGTVYKVRDLLHESAAEGPQERIFALKVAKPGTESYLEKEARMLTNFSHPHFPKIETVLRVGECVFVVMQFISGQSLRRALDDRASAPFSEPQVVEWMTTVLKGLDRFHAFRPLDMGEAAQGMAPLHRDIKPANLLVDESGDLYVVDLGIARSGYTRWSDHAPSRGGLGTPGFAPPEVANFHGTDRAVPASDLYSLGVTAFVLLTGLKRVPPTEEERERGNGRGEDPFHVLLDGAKVSAPMREWVRRATQLKIADRFQSAREMLGALERRGEQPTPEPPPSTGRPSKMRRLLAGSAAAITALAIGLGLFSDGRAFLTGMSEPPPAPAGSTMSDAPGPTDSLAERRPSGDDPERDRSEASSSPIGDPPPEASRAARGRDEPRSPVPGRTPASGRSPEPVPVSPEPLPPTRATIQVSTVALSEAGQPVDVPVLVNGAVASPQANLTVGDVHRFSAPEGWRIYRAEYYEGNAMRTPGVEDGAVSILITASTNGLTLHLRQATEDLIFRTQ